MPRGVRNPSSPKSPKRRGRPPKPPSVYEQHLEDIYGARMVEYMDAPKRKKMAKVAERMDQLMSAPDIYPGLGQLMREIASQSRGGRRRKPAF